MSPIQSSIKLIAYRQLEGTLERVERPIEVLLSGALRIRALGSGKKRSVLICLAPEHQIEWQEIVGKVPFGVREEKRQIEATGRASERERRREGSAGNGDRKREKLGAF